MITEYEGLSGGAALRRALDNIANARGVKVKQTEIRLADERMSEEQGVLFHKMLQYAYDGGIRFGLSAGQIDIPTTEPRTPRELDLWVFTLLDQVIMESKTTLKQQLVGEILGQLSQDDCDLVYKILDKDLRAGINASTIDKAIPDLLAKFDVMLAKPFAARHVKSWPVYVEPKFDGLRCIAEVNCAAGTVEFLTRSGKLIESLELFKPETLAFARAIDKGGSVTLDGEVTSGSFLESMSSVRKSKEQVEEGNFHIFDVLHRSAPGLSPLMLNDEQLEQQGALKMRRAALERAFKTLSKPSFVRITNKYLASSEDEVYALYERHRDEGMEGVIVKDSDSYYTKKRSASWLKIKAEETLDLPVVGAFEGTGQFAGQLGGLIVLNGEVEVKVGSGFSAEQRKDYWEAIQQDSERIANGERDRCRLIDCPVEVQFQEQLPSGSLRHPVFVRLRRDKQMAGAGAF